MTQHLCALCTWMKVSLPFAMVAIFGSRTDEMGGISFIFLCVSMLAMFCSWRKALKLAACFVSVCFVFVFLSDLCECLSSPRSIAVSFATIMWVYGVSYVVDVEDQVPWVTPRVPEGQVVHGRVVLYGRSRNTRSLQENVESLRTGALVLVDGADFETYCHFYQSERSREHMLGMYPTLGVHAARFYAENDPLVVGKVTVAGDEWVLVKHTDLHNYMYLRMTHGSSVLSLPTLEEQALRCPGYTDGNTQVGGERDLIRAHMVNVAGCAYAASG